MTGTVLLGINNIYTVLIDNREFICRIKGKILKDAVGAYNPLAVGDLVTIERDSHSELEGMITARLPRSSEFIRWNKKREAPQTIAANMDLLVCVSSPQSPPFRPRFIDRVLIAADEGKVPPLILMNKSDQEIPPDVSGRLAYYRRIGCETMNCSAKTGEGIDELRERISGKTAVFIGQSGVGKSSVLNALEPGLSLQTGNISRKYNRGTHTTNYAVLIRSAFGQIIDTPGIREIDIYGIDPEDLQNFFPEFLPYLGSCSYLSCTHLHEPGCAVRDAVESGEIHPDRYESYQRVFAHLEEIQKNSYG